MNIEDTGTDNYTGPEVLAMLNAPSTATDLPDGSIVFVKAGITSYGLTRAKALSAWGRLFADKIARPRRLETPDPLAPLP